MSQVNVMRSIKQVVLNRNFQNHMAKKYGQLGVLTDQQLHARNFAQQEYDRRKQQLADATTVEDIEAVSVMF